MVPISRWWFQPTKPPPWDSGFFRGSWEPCWEVEVSPGHRPLSPNLKGEAFGTARRYVVCNPATPQILQFSRQKTWVHIPVAKKINAFGWKLVKKIPGHPTEQDTWVLLFLVALLLLRRIHKAHMIRQIYHLRNFQQNPGTWKEFFFLHTQVVEDLEYSPED